MTLAIMADGMLDWKVDGSDTFFVRVGDDEVMLYEANTNGSVRAVLDETAPLRMVTASVEKFNNMYKVQEPVALDSVESLPQFVGKFSIISVTHCRFDETAA